MRVILWSRSLFFQLQYVGVGLIKNVQPFSCAVLFSFLENEGWTLFHVSSFMSALAGPSA